MGFLVCFLDIHWHHLGIELGGSDILMAKEFLDISYICPVLEKVSGAGSPEGMG